MARHVDVRYVYNRTFKRTMLNSQGVMNVVDVAARAIHQRACGMYGAEDYRLSPARKGKNRCHAIVGTGDRYSRRSNALHMTLKKSLKG